MDRSEGTESDGCRKDEEEYPTNNQGGGDAKEPGLVDRLVNYGPASARDTVEGEGADCRGGFGAGDDEMWWEEALEILLGIIRIGGGRRFVWKGFVTMEEVKMVEEEPDVLEGERLT